MKFENNGKDFVLPAEGPTIGVNYLVADLGTQARDYNGEKSQVRQLVMAFELPGQAHPETGKPLIQYTRRFTVSLSEKSALRPFLESWRGQKFSDTDIPKFSAKVLVGKAAMLQIGHESKSGKDRSQIMTIMGVPAGTKAPALVNTPLYFSTDEWDGEVFDKLPEWIKKVIALSPEYKARQTPATGSKPTGIDEDDIPF